MLKFSSPVDIYDRLSSVIKYRYIEELKKVQTLERKRIAEGKKGDFMETTLAFLGSHISHPLEIVFLQDPV